MTSTDLYLFDDSTSKTRGLCLLENTPASEGGPAGDWRWEAQQAGGGVWRRWQRPTRWRAGQWGADYGRQAGLTSEGRSTGVPRPSRPAMAARSCAGLEWIMHVWREDGEEVSWNCSFVFEKSLEPTFSRSISIQNQPNPRAFWTKHELFWVEPVPTRINPLIKHTLRELVGSHNSWCIYFIYMSRFIIIYLNIDIKLKAKTTNILERSEYLLLLFSARRTMSP
jgi:hypothetical protein